MEDLIKILQSRFEKNNHLHKEIEWNDVEKKLLSNPDKIAIINKMEQTGGEPDVVVFDSNSKEIIYCDCVTESPKDRRSYCYDATALNARKENKPKNNVIDFAAEIGIELLNEEQYFQLQKLGDFDLKTSSWLKTPDDVRKLGGAIFGDKRYNRTFIYHNGAESYYASRGFRGFLKL
jgi:hypothetical protein